MENNYVKSSKSELFELETDALKKDVEKKSWIALRQYYDGAGNGAEAKIAVVVIGTLAREMQSTNNRRQLDLVEKRMGLLE